MSLKQHLETYLDKKDWRIAKMLLMTIDHEISETIQTFREVPFYTKIFSARVIKEYDLLWKKLTGRGLPQLNSTDRVILERTIRTFDAPTKADSIGTLESQSMRSALPLYLSFHKYKQHHFPSSIYSFPYASTSSQRFSYRSRLSSS